MTTAPATGLYIGGQKIDFDLLSYDLPRFEPAKGATGFTSGEYFFESKMTTSDAAMADLQALFANEDHMRSTRIQWDEGRFVCTFDVLVGGDLWNTSLPEHDREMSFGLDFVPGGLASIACTCCGQGRAYSSARAAFSALRGRWARHVCPRGKR